MIAHRLPRDRGSGRLQHGDAGQGAESRPTWDTAGWLEISSPYSEQHGTLTLGVFISGTFHSCFQPSADLRKGRRGKGDYFIHLRGYEKITL